MRITKSIYTRRIMNYLRNNGHQTLHFAKLADILAMPPADVSRSCHLLEAQKKITIERLGSEKIVKFKSS